MAFSSRSFLRFLSGGRLADAVTTVLIVNALLAFVQGRSGMPFFRLTVPTPGLVLSVALLGAWAGLRFVLRHRERLAPHVAAWQRGHRPELIVAVLFAVGLTLRLSGIGFGAPVVVHPDEHEVVGVSINMMKSGSIKPPVPYHYPTVFHYVLLPSFGLKYARGKSAGVWNQLSEVSDHSFEFYELARAHSAMFGALTILLTFHLAGKLWPGEHGRWVGVLAATFLTFSFNHVKESHFAVTDATLTFFIVVAVIAIVSAWRHGTSGHYAIAGFACGIACATKYSALPVVFVLVAAFLSDWRKVSSHWRLPAAGLLAVPVGFFTGYPYAVLNWPPFLEHLGWMGSHAGTLDFNPVARFEHILGYWAGNGFGFPFAVALCLALVYHLHRRRPQDLFSVTFVVVTLALLTHTAHPFYPRYLVPIVPFAGLLVGRMLLESAERLSTHWALARASPRLVEGGLVLMVAVLVAPQVLESIGFARYSNLPDTRAQAYGYIRSRFRPGMVIASEDPYLVLPRDYKLLKWSPLQSRPIEDFGGSHVDALVFSDDREPHQGDVTAAQARRDLRERFPMSAVFPSREGITAGPTLSIYVRGE